MSRPARSVFVFGIYLLIVGTALTVAPNGFLALARVAPTSEVWIRVLGTIIVYVGTYYLVAAKCELVPIFRTSLPVRFSLIVFLAVFAVLKLAPVNLLFLGFVDAAGALWTWASLRPGPSQT